MFEDPNNDEKTHYDDLMDKCIVDHDTGLRLLPFDKPSKGVLSQSSSEASIAHKSEVISLDKQSVASGESPKLYKPEIEIDDAAEVEEDKLVKEERESEKSDIESKPSPKLSPASSKSSSGHPTGDVVEEEVISQMPLEPDAKSSPELSQKESDKGLDEDGDQLNEQNEIVSPSLSEKKDDKVSISSKTSSKPEVSQSEENKKEINNKIDSDLISEKSESVLSDDAVTVVKLFIVHVLSLLLHRRLLILSLIPFLVSSFTNQSIFFILPIWSTQYTRSSRFNHACLPGNREL